MLKKKMGFIKKKQKLHNQLKNTPNSSNYNLGNKIKVALDYKINYKINISESMLTKINNYVSK